MAETDIRDILFALREDTEKALRAAEEKYIGSVRHAAEFAAANGKKIILIAGPSGSGKTTTSELLTKELCGMGRRATVVSTDNFYRSLDDPGYPRDTRGELDFESVDALQSDKIIKCMSDIVEGGKTLLPVYDFERGISVPDAVPLCIGKDDILIIEGIHAFSPLFRDRSSEKYVMRLYVSVSTGICDGDTTLLSGRDIRFIRRMTRDSIYRATDAKSTYERWPSVLLGEETYLYPYKESADVKIDTFHLHELGIIKPFAEKALDASPDLSGAYIDNVRNVLSRFDKIPVDRMSPWSLLREFVPNK